jgi:peptidyl-tRNA hydrolase, PTH1 family
MAKATLFYGLGNNEKKYLKNKHNIGRLLAEKIAFKLNLSYQEKNGYAFANTKFQDVDLYFLHSLGFINNSGKPLEDFCKYFKKDFNIIVFQDDSDQLIGKQKMTLAGGSAGHRGIDNIYKYFSSNKIYRFKIGIRPEGNRLKSETFVLSNLNNFELERIEILSQEILNNLKLFNEINLPNLQNIWN